MSGVQLSQVKKAAEDVGINDIVMAADIIRMVIELQDNASIVDRLREIYLVNGKGDTLRRKFNSLVQSFIIHNFFTEFNNFCQLNGINIFNEDLDVTKESASYARIIFVVFLREAVGLKPELSIVRDVGGDA